MVEAEEIMPPINIAALRQLVGDDAELHQRLLKKFINSSTMIVNTITKASNQQDWAEVVNQAHKLKSSSRAVGAALLAELSENIEQAGKSNRADEVRRLAQKINVESVNVNTYITAI